MPVYNTEKFLPEAIEGVLGQTYPNLELVICDNQSTDSSLTIANQYAAKDSRVRVIQNRRNLGWAGNLNKAFASGAGDFLMLHCADDLSAPQTVEKLMATILKSPDPKNTVAVCDNYIHAFDGNITGVHIRNLESHINEPIDLKEYRPSSDLVEFSGHDLLKSVLPRLKIFGFIGACLFPQVLFKNLEGAYSGFLNSPDKDFMYFLLSLNPKVFYLREALVGLRLHEDNHIARWKRSYSINQALDAYVCTMKYGEILKKLNISRDVVEKAFIDEYCLRPGLLAIRAGTPGHAFKYLMFSLATYKNWAIKNSKFYLVSLGILLGPLGTFFSKMAYQIGIFRSLSSSGAKPTLRSIQARFGYGLNRLRYGRLRRYYLLPQEIRRIRAKTILDIGTFDGDNAARMIRTALENQDHITYYGFDLFEEMTPQLIAKETSKGAIHRMENVERKLKSEFGDRATIVLVKGTSTKTLPEWKDRLPKFDFIFIDGGHSYETVKSDWENVQGLLNPDSVVIFDDYVNEEGVRYAGYGTNRVINDIDRKLYEVELMKPIDPYAKYWGILRTRFAKVVRRKG